MDEETIEKIFDPFFTSKEVGKEPDSDYPLAMELLNASTVR